MATTSGLKPKHSLEEVLSGKVVQSTYVKSLREWLNVQTLPFLVNADRTNQFTQKFLQENLTTSAKLRTASSPEAAQQIAEEACSLLRKMGRVSGFSRDSKFRYRQEKVSSCMECKVLANRDLLFSDLTNHAFSDHGSLYLKIE